MKCVALIAFLVVAGIYLVVNGHPWFALLVMLMAACVDEKDTK